MLPLFAAVVAFSISNRSHVEIDLSPLPYIYEAPIFIVGLVGVLAGFLFGAVVVWLSAGKSRAFSRQLMRALDSSRREEAYLKEQIKKLEATPTPPPSATLLPGNGHKDADAA
jgi:hypothetical protein